ncbi:hypothetical protein BJ742DRAFT_413861 [Cladochytrium replicatum]|nr:hypothetical protein BJ742DRAFT_413861 [Cladochytrium replicatum]
MDDPSGQRTPRPSALFPHVLTLFETFCNNANDPAAAIAASSMYGLIAQPEIQRHMVQNCLGSFLTDFVFDERRGEIIKTHFPYIWPAWTQNPSFAESLKPYWRTVVSKLKMVGYAFGAPLQTVFNMMDRETLVKELGDDGIESLYEGILATLKDPMLPVQPLVELLGIVGQANKEYAGKCLEKLVDVVEVAMPVMGAKIVTQYDVLRCISTMKTIAEATGPSVLTPIKDRLAEILKSPQAMQTHKDAAKELFDYEAGRSAQQIYELLGLDKSDPFLQTANDVLTSSATDPSSLFDVMISYTQSQLALAVRIANALRTRGLKVWIDREFGGKDVYTRMAEGVIRSCVIVPCISKAYEADADRKKELGFAADQKRKVVPIRLSDGPFTWSALITAGLLYTYLAKAQTEDEGKFSQAMDGLAKEVEAGVIEYKELNKIPIEPRKPAVTESPEDDMVVVPPALAVGEEAALKADGVKVLDEDGQEIVDDHDDGRYVGVEEEIRVQEKYDLMLSYAWSHQPTVLRMRDWLRARGFNVWMDVDLMSGNVYSKMAEAVLGSRVIVACLTGTYDRSGNCRRELGYSRDQVLEGRKRRMKQSVEERQAQDAAKKFGKGLVPVLLEDTQYVFAGPLTQGLKSEERRVLSAP